MNTTAKTREKVFSRERAREEFNKLLAAVEFAGFYGTATIVVNIQDGNVEHMKVVTERQIK
jgi:hypothetical protein